MKHKLLIFVFTLTSSLLVLNSQAQTWQWVNRMGAPTNLSNSDETVTGVQADSKGNVYVTGRVMEFATFGSYGITSYGPDYQGFLARYDCSGNLRWVKTFGDNTSEAQVTGLALDASGNPYIVGSVYNGVNFGDTVVNPGNNYFVAKYDSSGKLKWVNFAKTIANPEANFTPGAGIAINSAGTVITSGFNTVAGTTWPGINLVHGDFLAAFSPMTGAAYWGTMIDTTAPSLQSLVILSMKLGSDDDIYFAGWFANNDTIGHFKLNTGGGNHGFIIKYNPNGSLIWAKQDYAISNFSAFLTMAISGTNMYIEGEAIQGDTVLGYPLNFKGTSVQTSFILKLDTGANLQWGITQDSASGVYSGPNGAMTTDNGGNLYFISGFADLLKWGTTASSINSVPNNGPAPYLLVLNPSGNVTSLTQFPCWSNNGISADGGEAIQITSGGDIYYAGAFSDKIWLPGFIGDTLYSSGGDNDLFVMKYGNICTTTAVDNIKTESEINVYPNPAQDKVTFESSINDQNLKGEIYNVFGQLVQIFKLNSELTTISTNNLSRGIYLYRILREDSVIKTGKIVLQ